MRYATLIASRNRYDLCLRAIASAARQSVPPELIVVVDDASDDPRYGGLESAADVQVVRLDRPSREITGSNFAVGYVRNAGLERLAGYDGWLAFLDDDDEWLDDKAARQFAVADAGGGVICGNAVNRTLAGEIVSLHHEFQNGREIAPGLRDVTDLVRFLNPVINSTGLIRPDVWPRVGRQQSVGYGEDWDWYRRAAALAPIHMVEDVVAYYTTGNAKEYEL
jgi:glycosyltransferase involved in cell wall biosynthesis